MAVKIYSTSTCPFCQKAKGFLMEHGIQFEDIDVSIDKAVIKEFIAKTGQTGVPVLEIGKMLIFGFDKEKIKAALGIE
ncbi:MAG: glutaredoxin family protein [Candidatus Margulisiibacteriota bacterium]